MAAVTLERFEKEVGLAPVTSPKEIDDEILQRLAALPSLEYDRQRKKEAERLGCRTSTLDELVEPRRPRFNEELQGRAMDLPDVELWPESVNGADVLIESAKTFAAYVALPASAADVLALWCTHAHGYSIFPCSPRLNISSPEKNCGKTTLRDVVSVLVPRALLAENLSVAVLFRVVQRHRPTVLADECDTWLRDNEELRGMLNAGHRRGGQALRCEGETNEVRAFNVFAPVVLCGIGALPGTLHDRSIVIRLERAKPGELSKRFDSRRVESEKELCRKLARFVADNGLVAEEVEKVNPDLVVHDDNGKPFTVRYEPVNAMLLNEFLKEHKKVEEQERKVQEQVSDHDQTRIDCRQAKRNDHAAAEAD